MYARSMGDMLKYPIRSDKFAHLVSVSRKVVDRESPFQRIEVIETEAFGRMLLLDGHVQLAELDEHAYHESLVHIPVLSLPERRTALVVGGGDGGAIRELCDHSSFEQIDMVEIDGAVIEACRLEMPSVSEDAFDDPRVHVYVEDAFPFVRQCEGVYDIIVLDSTDTYEDEEGELSARLFTHEFYEDCRKALRPGGILVTQADNPVFCPYSVAEVRKQMESVFPVSGTYQAVVPSFGGISAFCWGSDKTVLSPDLPLEARDLPLRYLNEATYAFAFSPLSFRSGA